MTVPFFRGRRFFRAWVLLAGLLVIDSSSLKAQTVTADTIPPPSNSNPTLMTNQTSVTTATAVDAGMSVCGNGMVESGEVCDEGILNSDTGTCNAQCQLTTCGDGIIQNAEECDDGNLTNGDDCTMNCAIPCEAGAQETCDCTEGCPYGDPEYPDCKPENDNTICDWAGGSQGCSAEGIWGYCVKPTEPAQPDCQPTVETCSDWGIDNDCDGDTLDAADTFTFYPDNDNDGHGDPAQPLQVCVAQDGVVANGDDCNDQDPAMFPGNPEVCDGKDNDCNGQTDENNVCDTQKCSDGSSPTETVAFQKDDQVVFYGGDTGGVNLEVKATISNAPGVYVIGGENDFVIAQSYYDTVLRNKINFFSNDAFYSYNLDIDGQALSIADTGDTNGSVALLTDTGNVYSLSSTDGGATVTSTLRASLPGYNWLARANAADTADESTFVAGNGTNISVLNSDGTIKNSIDIAVETGISYSRTWNPQVIGDNKTEIAVLAQQSDGPIDVLVLDTKTNQLLRAITGFSSGVTSHLFMKDQSTGIITYLYTDINSATVNGITIDDSVASTFPLDINTVTSQTFLAFPAGTWLSTLAQVPKSCLEDMDFGGTVSTCGDGSIQTEEALSPYSNGANLILPAEECDDGNTTDGDACSSTCKQQHVCEDALGNAIDVDDGNPCTVDTCDSQTGVTHTAVAEGTSCSDGDQCNGEEVCMMMAAGMMCVGGEASDIDDSDACTIDSCDATTGEPVNTPVDIDDADFCTIDACNVSTGVITHISKETDDGDACTTDSCDLTSGTVSHTQINVDDGDTCTTDSCNSNTGDVSHDPIASCCNSDSNCDDANACNGTETCIAAVAGSTCQDGTPLTCDDSNECTTDTCDASNGCQYTPDVSSAEGNACGSCGDGIVNFGEECDDGNTDETDGCTATCEEIVCGDGVVEGNEECDPTPGTTDSTCEECQLVKEDFECPEGEPHDVLCIQLNEGTANGQVACFDKDAVEWTRIDTPYIEALSRDPDGNLYHTDIDGQKVYKNAQDSLETTLFKDFSFLFPSGGLTDLTLDDAGIFIASQTQGIVALYPADSSTTAIWSKEGFTDPDNLVLDNEHNVYFTAKENGLPAVYKIDIYGESTPYISSTQFLEVNGGVVFEAGDMATSNSDGLILAGTEGEMFKIKYANATQAQSVHHLFNEENLPTTVSGIAGKYNTLYVSIEEENRVDQYPREVGEGVPDRMDFVNLNVDSPTEMNWTSYCPGQYVADCTPSEEVCDGTDNDCDDEIDEEVTNACGTCGDLTETCDNGTDDDCDGTTDEGCGCTEGETRTCTVNECEGTQNCVYEEWEAICNDDSSNCSTTADVPDDEDDEDNVEIDATDPMTTSDTADDEDEVEMDATDPITTSDDCTADGGSVESIDPEELNITVSEVRKLQEGETVTKEYNGKTVYIVETSPGEVAAAVLDGTDDEIVSADITAALGLCVPLVTRAVNYIAKGGGCSFNPSTDQNSPSQVFLFFGFILVLFPFFSKKKILLSQNKSSS